MGHTQTRRLIIISALVLLLLIVLTLVLTGLFRQTTSSNQNQITPGAQQRSFRVETIPTVHPVEERRRADELKRSSVGLTISQSERLARLRDKLPFRSSDFDIGYSPVLDQYFVQKKSPDAQEKFRQFAQENNISDIIDDFPELFTITNQSIDRERATAEKAITEEREEFFLETRPEQETIPPLPPDQPSSQQFNDTKPLVEVVKTFLRLDFPEEATPSSQQPPSGIYPTTLGQIFTEAGERVGTPPRILESIMRIECGRIFGMPPEEIAQYSQPGNGLPSTHKCYFNGTAYGPMQFLMSTWKGYASAVNRYGRYSHVPYIQNIRDSVYAAAEKLRKDSGATNPTIWTKEEVYRAAGRYYGKCVYKIDYCARAWEYYSSGK